jgi:hypothetical protein
MYRAKHYRVGTVSALVGFVFAGGIVLHSAVTAMAPASARHQVAVAAADPATPSITDPADPQGPPWG